MLFSHILDDSLSFILSSVFAGIVCYLNYYVCVYMCSVMSNSATLWLVAHQAPLSMGFSRQDYWSGLPFPIPGDLLFPGIKPVSLVFPAFAGRLTSVTWELV